MKNKLWLISLLALMPTNVSADVIGGPVLYVFLAVPVLIAIALIVGAVFLVRYLIKKHKAKENNKVKK